MFTDGYEVKSKEEKELTEKEARILYRMPYEHTTEQEEAQVWETMCEILALLKSKRLSRFLAVRALELTKAAMDEEPI